MGHGRTGYYGTEHDQAGQYEFRITDEHGAVIAAGTHPCNNSDEAIEVGLHLRSDCRWVEIWSGHRLVARLESFQRRHLSGMVGQGWGMEANQNRSP